jgi:hypothetical protein
MVYVDKPFYWPGKIVSRARKFGSRWCHLWCDPGEEEELHKFARRLGLKREYYQIHRIVNHYDLVFSKRQLAILMGAKPMRMIRWLKLRKERG